jgi:hypothetical protein
MILLLSLAAELAAMYHERLANTATALSLFSQARECYKWWGSNAKVRQVTEKISHKIQRFREQGISVDGRAIFIIL